MFAPVVFCSWVKLPAMKTRLSDGTTSMSQISPLRMRGVLLRGVSGTSRLWLGWPAVGGATTTGFALRVAGAEARPWLSVTTSEMVLVPPEV